MNMTSHKKVTIICADETSDLATIALRGVLEYFGYFVSTYWIGNKEEFLHLLQKGDSIDDILLICAHGTDGKFFMPGEATIDFDILNIQLPNKIVISTGCETHGATQEFMKGGCQIYVAPTGSPEGNDATFFVVKFFWLLSQGKNPKEAFEISAKDMPEGSGFMLSQNPL